MSNINHKWNKVGTVCLKCGLSREQKNEKTLMAIAGGKDYYKYKEYWLYTLSDGSQTRIRPNCNVVNLKQVVRFFKKQPRLLSHDYFIELATWNCLIKHSDGRTIHVNSDEGLGVLEAIQKGEGTVIEYDNKGFKIE